MKEDPAFHLSAYVNNKLTVIQMRVFRSVQKLKKIEEESDNQNLRPVILDLERIDSTIKSASKRTKKFLDRLYSKRKHEKKG